ncbi:hypothetical protein C8R46DRAFT_1364980 [Mycena filopes]|nr:hypothetical protein C8R46DRAFT_1364980 [Mycena filopes]
MAPTVQHLIWILELFFPPELAVQQALYVLWVLISLFPILRLHTNQLNEARRQAPLTGWMRTIQTLLTRAFHEEANNVEAWATGINLAPEYTQYICRDLDRLYLLLGLTDAADPQAFLFRPPRPILCTSRLNCKFCPPGDRNLLPSLRRRPKGKAQRVWLLDASFKWVSADLLVGSQVESVAKCWNTDTEFIRVSKHGVWVHRKIAIAQEKALQRFHSGWSNFADWVNDSTDDINIQFTYRQSQRLFVEHFSRRLLVAHGKDAMFFCEAHSPTKSLAEAVRNVIGKNGGNIPGAMRHGCMDCTHIKQYAPENGAQAGGEAEVVGSEAGPADAIDPVILEEQPLPANLPSNLPRQEHPPAGEPVGYTRLGVMDGKTLKHKVGISFETVAAGKKLTMGPTRNVRSMIVSVLLPITRTVASVKSIWISAYSVSHIDWHKQYEDRFHRLSFPGVQRVIRRQMGAAEIGAHPVRGPSLQVQLQALGDTPGEKVVHTFKAKSIYCVQTVQWACGVPIGWGKCYRSESTPQVLAFLNKIWDGFPEFRPSFIVYDKACELLRHIVTQNVDDSWLTSTKFIVDAWHYIGHRATDILCRTRCNPAPTNGSQPDLVLVQVDDNGVVHQTRAFNTETAEQLNSWLNGFESQLRQMTDVNFDFFMHVLMMVYGESVEKRVVSRKRDLTQEFWDEVNGVAMDVDIDN